MRKFTNILKFVAGVVLVGLLFYWLDFEVILESSKTAIWEYLLVSFLLFLLTKFFYILRFYYLIDKKIIFLDIARVYLVSLIFTNILPTNVGGDFYRVMYLKQKLSGWKNSLTLIIIERFLGIVSLFLLGLFCLLINYDIFYVWLTKNIQLPINSFYILILGCFLFLLVFYLLFKTFRKRLSVFLQLSKKTLSLLFGFSVLIHTFRALSLLFVLLGFNSFLGIDKIIIVITLVAFSSLVSITVGALGIKEGVMGFGFNFFGIQPELGVIASLVERIFTFALLPFSIYYFLQFKKQLDV
ncbi:MAG: flippase-like domain-containing protein [Thiopseudomonas sp.]|nr:flippase-like domain-containing protein [Thiopseudomonas sp.]MCK9464770.1 flippase-like domain-containing protein [Thiopseudomonas sp.]